MSRKNLLEKQESYLNRKTTRLQQCPRKSPIEYSNLFLLPSNSRIEQTNFQANRGKVGEKENF